MQTISTRLIHLFLIISFFSFGFCKIAFAQEDKNEKKLEYSNKTEKSDIKNALDGGPADSTKHWKLGVVSSVTFNQTALSNWSAGGNNAISLMGVAGLFANYEKGKHYWLSLLDASYGISKIEGFPLRKAQDYFEINTKYGYQFKKFWSATAFAEMITQFAPGFDYANDPEGKKAVSQFFSPAYVNQGLGISFDAKEVGFSARIAPLTGRQTFVLADSIDETRYGLDPGKSVRFEFGASVRLSYQKEIVKNLNVESRLFAFSNYLKEPEQILVNWRTKVDYKIAKILTISVLFHLIYDPTIQFPDKTVIDPVTGAESILTKRKVQWMQTLGVGLGYTLIRRK